MIDDLKKYADYFHQIGAADLNHTGDKSYLAHVAGVYRDLKQWGCDDYVCLSGLFHSVYGTEYFQKFTLPLERRGEVRAMIGDKAERLAYWNCAMDRAAFDAVVLDESRAPSLRDRITGDTIPLSDTDFTDLMTLHLCDWLEQVPRSQKWDYRREAYRGMAQRLGGIALQAYNQVFGVQTAV